MKKTEKTPIQKFKRARETFTDTLKQFSPASKRRFLQAKLNHGNDPSPENQRKIDAAFNEGFQKLLIKTQKAYTNRRSDLISTLSRLQTSTSLFLK